MFQQAGDEINLVPQSEHSSPQIAGWRFGHGLLQLGHGRDGHRQSGACHVEIPWGRLQQQDASPRQPVTGIGNEFLRPIAAHERSLLPDEIAWLTKSWLTAFASTW